MCKVITHRCIEDFVWGWRVHFFSQKVDDLFSCPQYTA